MSPGNKRDGGLDTKPSAEEVDMAHESSAEKGSALCPAVDYSGATEKTSKEEIQLVRKLDLRIMPTIWAMYFLNYVSETCAQPTGDILQSARLTLDI